MFPSKIIQGILVKVILATINSGILVLSSKFLGVSTRGEISLLILNLILIQGVSDVFTGYSLIYFIPKYSLKRIFLFALLFGLATATILLLILRLINKQIKGSEVQTFFLSLMVIYNTLNAIILLGKKRNNSFNFIELFQPLMLIAGIFYYVFFAKDYTLNAYINPLTFSFLLSFIISTFLVVKEIFNTEVSPKKNFIFLKL